MNIGVFDSGVGGKLIANALTEQLPKNKIIFISDDKHFPYGNKSSTFIYSRAKVLTQELIDQNCNLIVIGCNTITTHTINKLRNKFPKVKFVGIEPPIKPLAKLTKSKKVAIMATPVTCKSTQASKLIDKYGKGIKVYKIACHDLTKTIEDAIKNKKSPQVSSLIKKYLDKSIKQGVDVVGLACTHYPYILNQLQKTYPQVIFYDPAPAIIKQVKRLI